MSWQKEKHEHPWTTKAQAKRIAQDHKKQEHKKLPQKGGAARTDVSLLYGGMKRIANQR